MVLGHCHARKQERQCCDSPSHAAPDERALDRQFAQGRITPSSLASLIARIGETQGQLRTVHLRHHRSTAELLTPDQRQRYGTARLPLTAAQRSPDVGPTRRAFRRAGATLLAYNVYLS